MVSRQGLGLIGRAGVVEDVASLKGKKVAVPPPGVQGLVLSQMLAKAGLQLGRDVTPVPLGYADHPTALERGDVQAYIGTEPLCTQSIVGGVGVRVPGAYDTVARRLQHRPVGQQRGVEGPGQDAGHRADAEGRGRAPHPRRRERPGGLAGPAGRRSSATSERVYEEVLGNVGAEWRFDEERQAQFEGAGQALLEAGTIAGRAGLRALLRPRLLGRLSVRPERVTRRPARAGPHRRDDRRGRPRRARRSPPVRAGCSGVLAPLALLGLWAGRGARGLVSTRLLPRADDRRRRGCATSSSATSTVTLAGVVPFAGAGFDHLGGEPRALRGVVGARRAWSASAVGLLLGVSRLARDLLDPVLNALRAVPLFAWLPLVLIWFGIGESSARALIFLGALWPVLVAVGDSTARVPRAYVETARMLGTPRRDLWRGVYLPSRPAGGRHRAAAVADAGVDVRHRRRAQRRRRRASAR